MTFNTSKTAVARQYVVLWCRTSTGLPAAHQNVCPTCVLGTLNKWLFLDSSQTLLSPWNASWWFLFDVWSKTPSFPRSNITSALHMITRSVKEHTAFTEIAGGLETAHLLGANYAFSQSSDGAASWMSPWMLATPSMVSFTWCGSIGYMASSHGRTFSRQAVFRPYTHSSAVWEPCFISALHYTRDLSCGSHPWFHTNIP